ALLPAAGGRVTVLTSVLGLATLLIGAGAGPYADNQSRQIAVVEAAAGFSLSHTGAPLYGYSSMSLGFRAQTPLQIFEAETYPTSRVSPAVADGAASGGKAVQDPQGQPITPPSITSAVANTSGGRFTAGTTRNYV